MKKYMHILVIAAIGFVVLSCCERKEKEEVVFNEMLGSVLRGVLIKGPIAEQLGVNPGYYRIGEFRVWNETEKKAIVLNIHKAYGTYVDPGLSVLPNSTEEFVFSEFIDWEYNTAGRKAKVKDQHGHLFEFDIQWGDPCNQVTAGLDGTNVHMSTQSYLGSTLNSCGWEIENEGPFTAPY
jgi:hypothetical protein